MPICFLLKTFTGKYNIHLPWNLQLNNFLLFKGWREGGERGEEREKEAADSQGEEGACKKEKAPGWNGQVPKMVWVHT